jgi:VRR-NUC domain
MSEAALQALIVEAAGWLGYAVFHPYDSRRSTLGFPDLTLVHRDTGRVIFAELKSAHGRLTPEQREWLSYLGKRHEVRLWRPADWTSGAVLATLRAEQGAMA